MQGNHREILQFIFPDQVHVRWWLVLAQFLQRFESFQTRLESTACCMVMSNEDVTAEVPFLAVELAGLPYLKSRLLQFVSSINCMKGCTLALEVR